MPAASSVSETDVTIAASSTPTRLDVTPLAGRYWVRVVNPHATLRVFIGHDSTAAKTNGTVCESADPSFGVWEDSIGPTVPIYAVGEGNTSITVRVKQSA
jgi:hypothetical protein